MQSTRLKTVYKNCANWSEKAIGGLKRFRPLTAPGNRGTKEGRAVKKFNEHNTRRYTKAQLEEINREWEKMVSETGEEMNEHEFLDNFKHAHKED